MAVTTTLAAHDDDAPTPRVDVTMTGFDVGVVTATVYRISDGDETAVRNGANVAAAGGLFVVDYEVPLGVQVSYRAQTFNAGGVALGYSALSSPTQVDVAMGSAIFQDPLAPRNSVRAGMEQDFANRIAYGRDAQLYRAGNRTIALMSAAGLIEGLNLRSWTDTDAQANSMQAVLGQGVLLVRTMPGVPIPRLFYGIVATPSRAPFDARNGGSVNLWDLKADQISRPELSIIEAVINYGRYTAYYPTYADFSAAYPTYLNAIQNPPPEI